MKRVLITGANSYLGNNTKKYLEKTGNFRVDILDMLDIDWREKDFSVYDVVFNVCAIVHRPKEKREELYFDVNRDLAIEIAKKAKKEGVRQFIQTSTNGVFGVEIGEMNEMRGFKPRTPYEKSKYEADKKILELQNANFLTCIVRPPIIYGKGCKGNYTKMEKFSLSFPFFPRWNNKRDMIYIINICDFIKFAIDNSISGVCYPRDLEPVCVSNIVQTIAALNGRNIKLVRFINPLVFVFYKLFHNTRSVFGDNYCTEPICASNNNWVPPFTTGEALKQMYQNNF